MPNKSELGRADYVLYDDRQQPLAVIEAKRTCVDVSRGRQQAQLYADLLEKRGIKIDVARLSMLLDCPIVETSALKGEGLDKLIDEAIKTAKKKEADLPKEIFNKDLEEAVSAAAEVLPSSIEANNEKST